VTKKLLILLTLLVLVLACGVAAAYADETSTAEDVYESVEVIPEELPPADSSSDTSELEEELGVDEDSLGTEPLPEPPLPDERELQMLLNQLGPQLGFGLLALNGEDLLETSRNLAQIAGEKAAFLNTHPRIKRQFVRLCDNVVRLNAHRVRNEEIKQRVYRNMAAAYARLGCYHRAVACLERALKVGAQNGDFMRDIKYLYKHIGDRKPKVFVNGRHPNFDVQPTMQNGRTMVPIRALAETLGSKVTYNNGQVTFKRNNKTVNLFVNKPVAIVNGDNVTLDQSVTVINGRTLVPLRFVAENLDCNVDYASESGIITVDDTSAEQVDAA